jgi:hypothetical protein
MDMCIFKETEAQLSTMGLYVATALLGPSTWLQTITVFGYTVQYNHLFIALATFPMLQNIFSRYRSHFPSFFDNLLLLPTFLYC